jgi:hypothetical protein
VLIVKEVYLCHRINHKKNKMKKNLRNILVLAMGLMTTVSFAQDWNVDSRTRIDMGGDNDKMETAQRATVGATWGGSDWSIHGSTVVNYMFQDGSEGALDAKVYEAYASTDLMGYASVTMGRQALNYGSGIIIGSNEWNANRVTRDAFVFGLNLDMADVTVGYFSSMNGDALTNGYAGYYLNASKSEGDWSANLLYGSETITDADVEGDALTYMGLDLSYAMMDGNLGLDVSYNAGSMGDFDTDMMSIGATYNVNESMSIHASQTSYGEFGFQSAGGNAGTYGAEVSSWTSHGNMGHLGANQKDLAIGGSYAMGDFNLSATMHTVTDDSEGAVAEAYERSAMELSLGYTMSANAGLAVNYATDNNGTDTDTKYTWLTLTVRP